MLHKVKNYRSKTESGSALVYILIAIALLAALTFTFMEPASQQTSSQNTFKTISAVESQIHLIRSAIQQCILTYPRGDTTINASSTTDQGANDIYPINPNSSHFSSAAPGQSGDRLVRNIRCSGHNATGNAEDHVRIFSGQSGRFLPPAPPLFSDWQYYNGDDGIFFWLETDKSDLYIRSALAKLDDKYSECEVDIVDASTSAENLDSNGDVQCTSGSLCFRMFMITTASATYRGDEDGDEVSCP